jgi:hypothetical protein
MEGALGTCKALQGLLKMSAKYPDVFKVWANIGQGRQGCKQCCNLIDGDDGVHIYC